MAALFSLEGKIAVVTGTAQGVGLAVAKRFLAADAEAVIMVDINGKLGEEEAAKLNDKRADFYQLNVTDEEGVKKLYEYIKGKYGRVDILSNNAGIIGPDQPFEAVTSEEMHKIMEVNFFGYFHMIKYASPLMPNNSAIVNICSVAGMAAFPGYTSYNSSKGAVMLLTKSAALEMADRGIRVNCISPCTIEGPMAHAPGCEPELALVSCAVPLGRMCEPEEVAALIHFLAAPDCQMITGANVAIDGGITGFCYGRGGERAWLKATGFTK